MANDTKEIRSTLNNLVETNKDSEEGFRTSAEKLADPEIRRFFQTTASQRARFASELQSEVTRLGGEAETSGSTAGAMHRGWINLKAAIAGADDHSILEEAERGEDSAVKNYREALAKDLPSDVVSVIQRQYREVQQSHNNVRSLRDTGKISVAGSTPAY